MIRRTSIETHRKIEEDGTLSKRRWQVYDALYKYGPCTANELYAHMGHQTILNTNIVTRLGELREMGVVDEIEERPCKITNQTVIVWDTNDHMPTPLKKTPTKKEARIIELEEENTKLRLLLRRMKHEYMGISPR